MGTWLRTPSGGYALAWTQGFVDRAVADAFGYHALQLGLPEFDGLRANRMPHRWVAHDHVDEPQPIWMPPPADESITTLSPECPVALCADVDALPFPANSIDLVLMPHTLDFARDPHATVAEVERVLRPEGRVVIVGFNPMSLWGLRQSLGLGARLGVLPDPRAATGSSPSDRARVLPAAAPASTEVERAPQAAEFLGYRRVRDWLRLLSFDIEAGQFGCWRPPHATQKALDRMAWMDRVGSHWWPVLGGVYGLQAVKRVRGMRLVGLARKRPGKLATAPAVLAQRRRGRTPQTRG
jgi:SAM-dependent methyltransferase